MLFNANWTSSRKRNFFLVFLLLLISNMCTIVLFVSSFALARCSVVLRLSLIPSSRRLAVDLYIPSASSSTSTHYSYDYSLLAQCSDERKDWKESMPWTSPRRSATFARRRLRHERLIALESTRNDTLRSINQSFLLFSSCRGDRWMREIFYSLLQCHRAIPEKKSSIDRCWAMSEHPLLCCCCCWSMKEWWR